MCVCVFGNNIIRVCFVLFSLIFHAFCFGVNDRFNEQRIFYSSWGFRLNLLLQNLFEFLWFSVSINVTFLFTCPSCLHLKNANIISFLLYIYIYIFILHFLRLHLPHFLKFDFFLHLILHFIRQFLSFLTILFSPE